MDSGSPSSPQPPQGSPPASQPTANEGATEEAPKRASSIRKSNDGGVVERRPPEQIVVGEIRQNLDDLKSAILSYYSRLYSQPGRSIEERLDRLAAPPFSNTVKMGRLPPANKASSRPKRQSSFPVPPPNTCFDFLAEDQRDGTATRQTDLQRDPNLQKRFYGISQLPGDKPSSGMKGHSNLLGRQLGEARGGQINELLQDLRSKCTAASARLNTLADQLEREVEDPDLREWEYTTYPEVRRQPYLGRDPELRRHLLAIYRDLCHQSHTNQLRINAIKSKLRVLNLHTQSDMIKLKSDPRVAF